MLRIDSSLEEVVILLYSFNEISSNSPTWLDELRCSGTESELIDCPANAIGVEDCTHTQDVALVCGTGKSQWTDSSVNFPINIVA